MVLQDESDEYYFLPKHLLMGCQCKAECTSKCSCKKDKFRKVCSKTTCRYCTCFNRQPADDNLIDEDESSDNEASEISTDLEDYEWDFPLNEDVSNDNGFM